MKHKFKLSTNLKRFHSNKHTISINGQSPKVDTTSTQNLRYATYYTLLWKFEEKVSYDLKKN